MQEARGLGGVDAAAFLKNAYAGVDHLAEDHIEAASHLRTVLGKKARGAFAKVSQIKNPIP